MITENCAYFLGMLLSKGNIIELGHNKIQFQLSVKFRRPTDESVRSDNIYTDFSRGDMGRERLISKYSADFLLLKQTMTNEFGLNFNVVTNDTGVIDWSKREVMLVSDVIDNNDSRFISLFNVEKISNNCVIKFPFWLEIEKNRRASLGFVQGVCDASALPPTEASSQNGGTGAPRLQIEPDQSRWQLCIGLCKVFQVGLGIRVSNINWGHPQIRTSWKGQNHQFRVKLENIPPEVEIFRFEFKADEYHNLYSRKNVEYVQEDLCPAAKKGIHEGDTINVLKSSNPELDSLLLDEKLRKISVDVRDKKSMIVCYLLGCEQCKDFFKVVVDED